MTIDDIKVRDIMMEPITISETATMKEALELMMERRVNTLLAVDADGVFLGEVSVVNLLAAVVPPYVQTDDIAAHFISSDAFNKAIEESADKKVGDFYTEDRRSVLENASLMQVAVIAMDKGQARIPVLDEDKKPIGVITRRGLKKIIAAHLGIEWDK